MLLAIDIGNSSISIGVFDAPSAPETGTECCRPTLRLHAKMAADWHRSADEYAVTLRSLLTQDGMTLLAQGGGLTGVVIGSVVPPLTHVLRQAVERLTLLAPVPVTLVGSGMRTGISLLVDEPAQLGADIVANATAACWLYGAPVLVVDFGTATVISAVNANRALMGVTIAPGVQTALEGLRTSAAQIPYVELKQPDAVLGKNTADATRSGLVYGTACMVDGMIDRIRDAAHLPKHTPVVATGGLSALVAPHCQHTLCLEPDLTLMGLYHMMQRTQASRTGGKEGKRAPKI